MKPFLKSKLVLTVTTLVLIAAGTLTMLPRQQAAHAASGDGGRAADEEGIEHARAGAPLPQAECARRDRELPRQNSRSREGPRACWAGPFCRKEACSSPVGIPSPPQGVPSLTARSRDGQLVFEKA